MSLEITIKGRVPSKKNSRNCFVRGGKMMNIPSKKYKEWHKAASEQLVKYITKGKYPLVGIENVTVNFWAPDKRKTDLTNKAESILDLLVDNGIIEDDNWFILSNIKLIFKGIDRETPRCEVVIESEKQ